MPFDQVLAKVIYPLVPQKRLLEVQEIADYALFLASEKARGVTGQAVVIDGGYTAQYPLQNIMIGMNIHCPYPFIALNLTYKNNCRPI